MKTSETAISSFGRRSSWLLVVVALGIILPGAGLSYLGFRSFQFERLLLKKQTEERYSGVANVMQRKSEELFMTMVTDLENVASSEAFGRSSPAAMEQRLSELIKVADCPVRLACVFDRDEKLWIPRHADSYQPALLRAVDWGRYQSEIQRLEQLEFGQHNVAGALAGYQALGQKPLPVFLQVELLKITAALSHRLGNDHGAELDYQRIIKEFDPVTDATGDPAGLVAHELLSRLYDSSQQPGRAVLLRLDYLEGLLYNRWELSTGERDSVLQKLDAKLRSAPPSAWTPTSRTRWTRLQEAERARLESERDLRAMRSNAEQFAASQWPRVIRRLHERGNLERGDVLQWGDLSSNASTLFLVAAPVRRHADGGREGICVAIVDAASIWSRLRTQLQDLAQPAGVTVQWTDPRRSRQPATLPDLLKGRSAFSFVIQAVDPPLSIQLLAPANDAYEPFLQRRIRIFEGMLALSFIVITVGVAIMGFALKREIQMAELKSEFVANVSHQIRTPLYAIAHIGERLNLGRYRSPDEVKEFYALLGEETRRLRELVDDALDFSKMLAGRRVYQRAGVDLNDVAIEAERSFHGKATARGFRVACQPYPAPVMVEGDLQALIQAVLNLLDNALKYSAESKPIEVRVGIEKAEGFIAVQDQGLGISASDQKKIFEKFFRAEHSMRRTADGGVGLGLSIVKHIVDAHAGRIQIQSIVGQGSCFTLYLGRSHS